MTTDIIMAQSFAHLSPAEITADFDTMRSKLNELLQPYIGMTPDSIAEMPIKDVKHVRADINAIVKNVDDARKAVKRDYNKPLQEFESAIADLLAPAKQYSNMLADAVNIDRENKRQERYATLAQSYAEFGGEFAANVEFDKVLQQEWLNASFGEQKALEAMYAAVEVAAKDFATLQTQRDTLPCFDVAEREYLRSLDLGAAISAAHQAQADQERAESIKTALKQTEQIQQSNSPQTTAEPAEPVAEERDTPKTYTIMVTLTDQQKHDVIAYFKANGIQGRIVRSTHANN